MASNIFYINLFGEDSHFYQYFSNGLKPPTRLRTRCKRHPPSEVEIKHEIAMLTKIHATVRALGSFTLYPSWSKRAVLWKSFMGSTIPKNAHTIPVGVNHMMNDFVSFFDVLIFFLFNFLWEDSIRNDQQTSNWLVIVMVNVFRYSFVVLTFVTWWISLYGKMSKCLKPPLVNVLVSLNKVCY